MALHGNTEFHELLIAEEREKDKDHRAYRFLKKEIKMLEDFKELIEALKKGLDAGKIDQRKVHRLLKGIAKDERKGVKLADRLKAACAEVRMISLDIDQKFSLMQREFGTGYGYVTPAQAEEVHEKIDRLTGKLFDGATDMVRGVGDEKEIVRFLLENEKDISSPDYGGIKRNRKQTYEMLIRSIEEIISVLKTAHSMMDELIDLYKIDEARWRMVEHYQNA